MDRFIERLFGSILSVFGTTIGTWVIFRLTDVATFWAKRAEQKAAKNLILLSIP